MKLTLSYAIIWRYPLAVPTVILPWSAISTILLVGTTRLSPVAMTHIIITVLFYELINLIICINLHIISEVHMMTVDNSYILRETTLQVPLVSTIIIFFAQRKHIWFQIHHGDLQILWLSTYTSTPLSTNQIMSITSTCMSHFFTKLNVISF